MSDKKNILVVGGTGEIGSKIVEKLLKNNCDVSFTYYKNTTKSSELEKLGAKSHEFNIFQKNAFAELLKSFQNLDAIIYSLGLAPEKIINKDFKKIAELEDEIFDEINHLFVKAPYQLIREVTSKIKSSGGNILFVNTLDGIKTQPGSVAFSQCRSSVKGLIESASRELGPLGIKINQVSLGLVQGKIQRAIPKNTQEKYLKYCALGRFANPDEVATMLTWLSLNNTYMTGESVVLDGAL